MINRRNALKSLTALGATSVAGGLLANTNGITLPKDLSNKTILFQGDSITDAGRDRRHYYPNQGGGMGQGYVRHIVTELLGQHPASGLKIYNRGVGGDKVFQLKNRWEDDCLQLKPHVLSIMIGVNDFWHTLSHNYQGTAETYERDLDELIQGTTEKLPGVQLIFGEPFVCHEGTAIDIEKWKGSFEKYQQACRRVADKYEAAWVPYQSVFDEALKDAPTDYWCPDGVHPSMAGNYLMANAWLEAFAKI